MVRKNTRKWWLLVVMLLVVPMIMAACGDDDDDDGDGGDANTGGELSQTLNESGFTVQYPEGWSARVEEGQLLIANSPDLMDRVGEDSAPQSGEFGLVVLPQASADLGGMTPDGLLGMMAGEGAGDPESVQVGDIDAFRISQMPGDLEGQEGEGFMVAYTSGDYIVIGVGVAAPGELSNYESTALEILGTVQYEAPAE